MWRSWISVGSMAISSSVVVAVVGYALYFDRRRRSDPEFRRRIRQAYKDEAQIEAQEAAASDSVPIDPADRDKYFLDQITKAEQAMKNGSSGYPKSAKHFVNAIKVYPHPQELLTALRSSVPEALFMEIMKLLQEEFQKQSQAASELDTPLD